MVWSLMRVDSVGVLDRIARSLEDDDGSQV